MTTPNLDEEAHGGDIDLASEDTTLLPQNSTDDLTKNTVAVSSFVSTTLWLLALAGCLALITASFDNQGGMTKMFEVKPTREIMLFGDSLVGVSEDKYHIAEHLEKDIEKDHNQFDVKVSTSPANGNCAHDLLKRVEEDVLNRPGEDDAPDAVVVLFDSDAADVDSADTDKTKQRYKETLTNLMERITGKVDYVALAGPILKGELKEGRNDRDEILNDYEDINIEVAKHFDIEYIPLREYFFAHEKKSEHAEEQKSGKLTIDGEHPLEGGAEIIQENILKTTLKWHKLWEVTEEDEEELKRMNDLSVMIPTLFSRFYNSIFGESEFSAAPAAPAAPATPATPATPTAPTAPAAAAAPAAPAAPATPAAPAAAADGAGIDASKLAGR